VALGIGAALVGYFRAQPVSFKVTPKDTDAFEPLPLKLVMPFAFISVASSSAAIFGERFTAATGYIYLSLLAGVIYALVAILLPVRHAAEAAAGAGASLRAALRETARPVVLAGFAMVVALTAVGLYPAFAIRTLGL
jgi:cellulose synthase (UDP-forming)